MANVANPNLRGLPRLLLSVVMATALASGAEIETKVSVKRSNT